MRALVFLSCFKAYREPSECVIYSTVEQVVGQSDRFTASRNSVRHNVYSHCGNASLYSSRLHKSLQKITNSNQDGFQAVTGHTNTTGMTMYESNTHKQV